MLRIKLVILVNILEIISMFWLPKILVMDSSLQHVIEHLKVHFHFFFKDATLCKLLDQDIYIYQLKQTIK